MKLRDLFTVKESSTDAPGDWDRRQDEQSRWHQLMQELCDATGVSTARCRRYDYASWTDASWTEVQLSFAGNDDIDDVRFTADLLNVLWPKLITRYQPRYQATGKAEIVELQQGIKHISLYADLKEAA